MSRPTLYMLPFFSFTLLPCKLTSRNIFKIPDNKFNNEDNLKG